MQLAHTSGNQSTFDSNPTKPSIGLHSSSGSVRSNAKAGCAVYSCAAAVVGTGITGDSYIPL